MASVSDYLHGVRWTGGCVQLSDHDRAAGDRVLMRWKEMIERLDGVTLGPPTIEEGSDSDGCWIRASWSVAP